jgi:hypothetical protein
MTSQERLDRELRRQEVLLKYQLVTDFVRKLSELRVDSRNTFDEFVPDSFFKQAIVEMNDLKNKYLES